MKISILLPYKENFSSTSGAVSNHFKNNKKDTYTVFGSTT